LLIDCSAIPNIEYSALEMLTSVATGQNGEFDIQHLDAATFEIQVEMPGFGTARYNIIVKKPSSACKKMHRIELRVAPPDLCPADIRLVKKTIH
jgi:hypothetical protein